MPSRFTNIKKAFHELDHKHQDQILRALHDSSKETRALLESRLLHAVDTEELIQAMRKETLDKVFRRPIPQTPDGRKIRAIIAQAKMLGAGKRTRMELERLAFMGFVDFMNEYGGGPDSFDGMAYDHLEAYLELLRVTLKDKGEQDACLEEMRSYLQKKRNMFTDDLYALFEERTGLSI